MKRAVASARPFIARILVVASVVLTLSFAFVPGTTQAFNILDGACSTDAGSSALCQGKDNTANPISGTQGIILLVVNIVATIAGVAAVIIILLAGLKYISSGGDAAKVQSAKTTLLYAVIGLVVIVLAHSIISLVVTKL